MKIKFLVVPALLLSLVACTQQSKAPVEQPTPIVLEDTTHPQIKVIYGSEAEFHTVKILDKQMDLTGSLPRAIIRLKNVTTAKVPFEYKCTWEDEFGAPIITTSAWQRVTIPQNGEKVIVDMGKSVKAKKVSVQLRFPQDVQIWVPTPDPAQMQNQQPLPQ